MAEPIKPTEQPNSGFDDVPSFLRSSSVLQDEEQPTDKGDNADNPPGDTPPADGTDPAKDNADNPNDNKDGEKPADDAAKPDAEDKKPEDGKPKEDGAKEADKAAGKDETAGDKKDDKGLPADDKKPQQNSEVEALKKELSDLQEAFSKLTKQNETTDKPEKTEDEKSDIEKQIDMLHKTPVVTPSIPKISLYKNDDDTYDLDSWMSDAFRAFTIDLQKSLTGGPLAAAQFGILQQAMSEVQQKRITQNSTEERALTITQELEKNFPRLKEDTTLQEIFVSKILAEKERRKEEAKGDPSKYVEPEYDDYAKILAGLIEYIEPKKVTEQKVDPVPKITGGPALIPDATPADPILSDIEDMKKAKRTSFF